MQIAVIGLGYVGLVTAACLARLGHSVVGLESETTKVDALLNGGVPYFEPGMDAEVAAQREASRLRFTSDPDEALAGAEVILICVGTPSDPTGRADLSHVLAVTETLAQRLTGSPVVVLRSTVPVGTTRHIEGILNKSRGDSSERSIAIIANPEFLRTGRAIDDFLRPSRIILGRTDLANDRDVDVVRELYGSIVAPIIVTDSESAELVKNASNAFLATKISFVNELAQLCEATGASIDDVVAGVAADPRIGGEFLRPGLGYGGSCLPKDVRSLIAMGSDHGQPMKLAIAVDAVNREQPSRFVNALGQALGGDLTGRRIAILGLAFKPETDDIRDSPGVAFARAATDRGAQVVGVDPVAGQRVREREPWLEIAADPAAAAKGADALVLATEWPAYVSIDLATLARVMTGNVLVDARNAYDPMRVRNAGLTYVSIGRGN